MSPGKHAQGLQAEGGRPADEPWARTSDRNVWRACRAGLVLTVTRVADGSGWQATVEGPGTAERSGVLATRLAAQSWAGNRAGGMS